MTHPTYQIAHGGAAVQAARIIAGVAKERRIAWQIEVLNKDGSHHSFVPRYAGNIEPKRALECINMTLDHGRFVARMVTATP